VWELSWSHPKFGSLLASCGYDNLVIIWKEVSSNVWQPIYQSNAHTASVNSLSWAPYEHGLHLAAASSDGSISITTYQSDGTWTVQRIENAHPVGVNSVTWAPAGSNKTKRIASGGCDNTIKLWHYDEVAIRWIQDGPPLLGHSDWVRDVAWAPNLGVQASTIASAGQDGRLIAWSELDDGSGGWDSVVITEFSSPIWRVNWSTSGNALAATDGQGSTTIWKEVGDGKWCQVSD
jgi:protein transport protein SEC13